MPFKPKSKTPHYRTDGIIIKKGGWKLAPRSEEHKKNLSNALKGRNPSPGAFKKGHVNTKTPFPKGMVPWNKGLHPEYVQGKNHPMYGKKFSDESRRKMSNAHKRSNRMIGNKINLGRKASEETKIKLSERSKRQKHSESRREKARIRMSGSNSPFWKGGISPLTKCIYESAKYEDWRKKVLQRDGYVCQECRCVGGSLQVHHNKISFSVIFNRFLNEFNQFSPFEDKETLIRLAQNYEPFWNIDNGQTLCVPCHKLTSTYGVKKINAK